MALDDSALSDLLDALRVGEGTDLVRELAQFGLQQLIELEATEAIGAGRYERTDGRVTERNGSRPKLVTSKAGDLELKIPKLRQGSFFPSLLEPRRRIDQALYAVIMEAYVNGVSTRKVDDLVVAMGADTGISKSEVSRICAGLDERVGAFRNRTLGHVEFPYVYLDATYVNVRDDALGQVVSRAVVVATGITGNGNREVLGVDIGDSEDETFWTGFLRSLKTRGLAGVRLVISDAHAGLKASIRKCFSGASWQRCRVHYARIDRPSGAGMRAQSWVGFRLRRRRCCSRSLATRSWRAASSVQPRAWASSRRATMSACCSSRTSTRLGSGTKLSHCSHTLA
jgi:putative transposase